MTVLVIEDDIHKSKQIGSFLEASFPSARHHLAHSFHSGLERLLALTPDVALLDMTLPNFDIVGQEDGGRTRTYGGRDLLYEIQDRQLRTRVVVITQYETFGESTDSRTLAQVTEELLLDFPGTFIDTVYYHTARSDWRTRLLSILTPILTPASR